MLKIGDFSKLSRISIRMLRHYDEIGLLVPENVDKFTGYRYYSESQLLLANRINSLKDMGFGLTLISEILKTCDDNSALHKFLLLKKAEMKEQSDRIGKQLLLLNNALNEIRKGENAITYAVTLKEMPQRYVASLRKIIPTHDYFEGVLKLSMLLSILMEIDSERTVDLIKFSSLFLLLIIGITICVCSLRYKGFRIGVVLILFLLIFLAWLSFNSVSSIILDFIFYSKFYLK